MQLGPSPQTQEYCRRSPRRVPPAQWGNHDARETEEQEEEEEEEEEECELFRHLPAAEDDSAQLDLEQEMARQDELDIAAAPSPSNGSASNLSGPWSACTP